MAIFGRQRPATRSSLLGSGGVPAGAVRVGRRAHLVGVAVIDVVFVLLTLVVFGLLALAAKGAEKL